MNSVPDLQRQRERQNKDPRLSRTCSTLVETTRETQNCDLTSQKKKAKTSTGEATLIDVLNTQLKDSTHAKLINELMCSTRITKMWRCFVFRFPVESTMACSLFGKQNTGASNFPLVSRLVYSVGMKHVPQSAVRCLRSSTLNTMNT